MISTLNLGLGKPEPIIDDDIWGLELNTNFDKLDAAFGQNVNAPADQTYGRQGNVWNPVLPLTGGHLSGPLISSAPIETHGAPITTDNTMLCNHLAAGIAGLNVGGFVGSWNTVTGGYTGFYTDSQGNLVFASADAGLGTITGPRAAINPNSNMQVYGTLAVGGTVQLGRDPAAPMEAVTLQYLQNHGGGGGGLADAPSDGTSYGRMNAGWTNVLALTGGALSGPLTLNGKDAVTNAALIVNGGDLEVGNSHSITTAGTMLCGHLAAGKAGDPQGGMIGSWNTTNNAYTGFYTDASGTLHFCSADAATGNVIAERGTWAQGGVFAPAGAVVLPGNAASALQAVPLQQLPVGSNATPAMDGAAAAGSSGAWAHGDHVHPTDTSRAAASALGAYLPLIGGALSGLLTLPSLAVSAPAGNQRPIYLQTAGVNRWMITAGAAAESGSNAGSSLTIQAYDDSGNTLGLPAMQIVRATGAVTFNGNVSTSGQNQLTAGGTVLGARAAAGQAGANAGGTLQSWNAVTGKACGFYTSDGTNFVIAPLTPGTDTPVGWYATLQNNNLTIAGGGYKPGGGAWADSSDARIKTEVSAYGSGLAQVTQLRPIVYRFKGNDGAPAATPYDQGHADDRLYVGLIAQEAETVMPEMVDLTDGWIDGQPVADMRELDTTPLVFALVNATKELAARLAALEARR